jgi:uncharacterized protein (TIGR02265 family)
MADLRPPNFASPLDVTAVVEQVPKTAMIKGFFVDSFEKIVLAEKPELKGRLYEGWERPSYSPLRSYWRGEILRVEAHLSQLMFPSLPLREAIRQACHRVYPTFLTSLLGRVVLVALIGNDIDSVLKSGPKMMSSMVSYGSVDAERKGDRHWVYHYKDYYSWLDCGDVGVIEGLLEHYGCKPTLTLATNGPFEMWLDIQWA